MSKAFRSVLIGHAKSEQKRLAAWRKQEQRNDNAPTIAWFKDNCTEEEVLAFLAGEHKEKPR